VDAEHLFPGFLLRPRHEKLEEAWIFSSARKEKLWFWGVDRAEDMGFSAEFLKEAGLRLDTARNSPERLPACR